MTKETDPEPSIAELFASGDIEAIIDRLNDGRRRRAAAHAARIARLRGEEPPS